MTQAIVMLRALVCTERLNELARAYKVHIGTLRKVTFEASAPKYDMLKSLRPQIPINCWFDEATDEFIEKLQNHVTEEKKRNHLKNVYSIMCCSPQETEKLLEEEEKKAILRRAKKILEEDEKLANKI